MSENKYRVLLVDDSKDDRFFMRMALERSPKFVLMREARDGQEVLDYLGGEGAFNDRKTYPIPDIVLLDLKMPRKNGYDVLQWLKTQTFKNLAVVVVSDSALPGDVAQSTALGAVGHFRKTSVKGEYEAMLGKVVELIEKRCCAA